MERDGYAEFLLSDKGIQIPDFEREQSKMRIQALKDRMEQVENMPLTKGMIEAAFSLGVNPFGL